MSQARFDERKAEVRASATRLAEVVALPESEVVRDATIQRFEFTFEVVWKALKLYLERQGHECGGPRPTLKKAFAEGILASAEEADVWMRMLDDRNATIHAYDEPLAHRIYASIVRDYAPALGRMASRIEGLSWE
jgi:nucleotidyltransferase substrate binding protein (TIGR01987 family)